MMETSTPKDSSASPEHMLWRVCTGKWWSRKGNFAEVPLLDELSPAVSTSKH